MKWLRIRNERQACGFLFCAAVVHRWRVLWVALAWLCATSNMSWSGNAADPEIALVIPAEDGGTPRNRDRIEQIGRSEFRVRAAVEEGYSPLAHAVSRVDLLCHNATAQARPVTLHLDLSNDGQRTDYDNKPEAGMKQRDYVFIQAPGKSWQQVTGETDGWVATVRFSAEPGDTKIGLSPWYRYGDLLRFLRGLAEHPHLENAHAVRNGSTLSGCTSVAAWNTRSRIRLSGPGAAPRKHRISTGLIRFSFVVSIRFFARCAEAE